MKQHSVSKLHQNPCIQKPKTDISSVNLVVTDLWVRKVTSIPKISLHFFNYMHSHFCYCFRSWEKDKREPTVSTHKPKTEIQNFLKTNLKKIRTGRKIMLLSLTKKLGETEIGRFRNIQKGKEQNLIKLVDNKGKDLGWDRRKCLKKKELSKLLSAVTVVLQVSIQFSFFFKFKFFFTCLSSSGSHILLINYYHYY